MVAADLMPRVVALRAFSYSPDGIRARLVDAGQELDVPVHLLADMISIGDVERADLAIPPAPSAPRRGRPPKSDSDES